MKFIDGYLLFVVSFHSLSSLSFPPLSFFYLLLPAEDKSGSGKDHDNGRTSSSPPLRLQLCRLPWQQSRQTGRVVGSPTKIFILWCPFYFVVRIPLMMSHESAALIGGLRQAVDDMIVRIATNPAQVTNPLPLDSAIIQAVQALVSSKATPPTLPEEPSHG